MSRRLPLRAEVVRTLTTAILLLVGTSFHSGAQTLFVKGATKGTPDHVAYLEMGGIGYYYTLNYEIKLLQRSAFAMFGRIGLEYLPVRQADRMVHLPIGASFTIGQKKHRIEAGIAGLFRIDFSPVAFGEGFYLTNPPTRIFLAPSLGWRFHAKPNEYGESFFLRVMFTPLIGMDVFKSMPYFLPHAGISVGRTWNNPNRKKG
ncbi:MAG: hypothetical protein K9J06_00875 [Flavobacteriales bacterium]|nr:hypothetical protein [Flavobacteriales bacterium]